MIPQNIKEEIITVAHVAFSKGLTAGWGGNISVRIDEETIAITPHKTSLGFLKESDIIAINLHGEVISETEKRVSTESAMHCALYRETECKAVIHLHPPHINALVSAKVPLSLSTYESALTLGGLPPIIPQSGPTVTDTKPLTKAFETTSIAILEKHGIVATGDDLSEAFSLADVLEEAAKITILKNSLASQEEAKTENTAQEDTEKELEVFSQKHLAKLQELINNDEEAQKLGVETDLTVNYAIKQLEDGTIHNMHFVKGKLEKITDTEEEADFINMGKKEIWIHVFNGRLDPFAATSQKKLRLLKGHIGDLSKWYAPFYRIFDLWKFAPVKELENE